MLHIQVMSTYHTLLEGEDQELASRVAWSGDGKLIIQEPRDNATEYLKLLKWKLVNNDSNAGIESCDAQGDDRK